MRAAYYVTAPSGSLHTQTCIRNLIGSWPVQRCGSGFSAATAGAKTSLSAFRADPDSLRIQLAPIRDATSNLEMHFSFQVGPVHR